MLKHKLLKAAKVVSVMTLTVSALLIMGCNPSPSSPEQLAEFESKVVATKLSLANSDFGKKASFGPYRLVVGDVVELYMPTVLTTANPKDPGRTEPHFCRVEPDGMICLPIVGNIQAEGLTLSEIEASVVNAFYPKHVVSRPAVVAKVNEYRTVAVSISGAVKEPGNFELRNNELSLSSLINKASGIVREGAGAIRINRVDRSETEPIIIPIKNLNTPYIDLALVEGDMVEVEPIDQQVFTVLGMVNKAGVYPYPVGTQYNLMEAIAAASGVDVIGDPRYAKVYRSGTDGELSVITVKIDKNSVANASRLKVKPGDVIAVEQTPRAMTRKIFAEVFRIGVGASYGID